MAVENKKVVLKFSIEGINQLNELQRKTFEAEQALKKYKKTLKGQGKISAAQANKLTKLKTTLKGYNAELRRGETQLVKNAIGHKRLGSSIKGNVGSLLKMGMSVMAARQALMALKRLIISSVKEFAKFEKGIKNVLTLMSNIDKKSLRTDIWEGSLSVMKRFGFGMSDVNKALFDTVSAGVPAGQSIKFLNDASVLAVAGVTDLKSAVTGIASVMNAYGLAASEATRISEILFTTQKFGITTVSELSESIGVVLPFAAASGISFEELGAAISVTTRSGLDATKTVTALRAAIAQMQNPAAESMDLFSKYGIPVGAAEMKLIGFTETMRRLNIAYADNPAFVEQMFGNVRGLTAILSIAGDNMEMYNEQLGVYMTDTGAGSSLTEALAENLDSAAMNLDRMTTAWSSYKVALGDSDFAQDLIKHTTDLIAIAEGKGLASAVGQILKDFGKNQKFFGLENLWLDDEDDWASDIVDQINEAGLHKALDGVQKDLDRVNVSSVEALESIEKGGLSAVKAMPEGYKVIIDDIIKKTEGLTDEMIALEGEGSMTASQLRIVMLAKSYKESFALIETSTNAELQAKIDAEEEASKAKDKIAMDYRELERVGRLKLNEDMANIAHEGLVTEEDAIITKGKLLDAELKHFNYLNNQKGKVAKETSRVNTKLAKLETQKIKNTQAQDRKGYADAVAAGNTELYGELYDIKSAAIGNDKEQTKAAQLEEVAVKIAHFKSLLDIEGQSTTQRANIVKNIKDLELQQQQLDFESDEVKRLAKIDAAAKTAEAVFDITKQFADRAAENDNRRHDEAVSKLDEKLAKGTISEKRYAKEKEKLDKKAFEDRKKNELKMATISFAQQLVAIQVQAASNPMGAVTFGGATIAHAAFMSALAAASFAVNVGMISSQKFADGGMVRGASHKNGGVKFNVGGQVNELEGGEAVLNRRSTAMFGNTLSAMNVAGGGKSFASPNLGGTSLIDYEAIGAAVAANTHVVLPVESLNKTQNRVKAIESSSRF